MEKLTRQEEEAMLLIWKAAPCCVKDVLECYEEPRPPYTTLASIVKNLQQKGFVKARRVGSTYEYTPLVAQADYKRDFLRRIVSHYFDNSYKEMVSFFAEEQVISDQDLTEIMRMIQKEKKDH